MFLIAAFLPSSKVFTISDPEKRIEIIYNMHGMFNFSQVLFGLGSIVTVIGLGMLIRNFKGVQFYNLAYAALLIMFVGALLWSWHVTERMLDPEGWVYGRNTPYIYVIYNIFTMIGLILIGLFLLKTSVADWIGWMLTIGSALFLILLIILKDLPPFIYYVLTLTAALALYFSGKVVV